MLIAQGSLVFPIQISIYICVVFFLSVYNRFGDKVVQRCKINILNLRSSSSSTLTFSLRPSISLSLAFFSSLHETFMHFRGAWLVFGLFPPKWGCCKGFFWAGVAFSNVSSVSSSDHSVSDSEELSRGIGTRFSFWELVEGLNVVKIESSILATFWERRDSSRSFSSAFLRFFLGRGFG